MHSKQRSLFSLLDIDECQSGSACRSDLVCNNTFGSYRCECALGFVEDPGWFCTVYDWIKRLKGIWWMPWRAEAMKDVIHCDKVWGAVNRL